VVNNRRIYPSAAQKRICVSCPIEHSHKAAAYKQIRELEDLTHFRTHAGPLATPGTFRFRPRDADENNFRSGPLSNCFPCIRWPLLWEEGERLIISAAGWVFAKLYLVQLDFGLMQPAPCTPRWWSRRHTVAWYMPHRCRSWRILWLEHRPLRYSVPTYLVGMSSSRYQSGLERPLHPPILVYQRNRAALLLS